jgi:hypothetical protein
MGCERVGLCVSFRVTGARDGNYSYSVRLVILGAQFLVATTSTPVTRKEFMMKSGNREIAL